MRVQEVIEPNSQDPKPVDGMALKVMADLIKSGNWTKAITLGALKVAPSLKSYLTTDQWRVLNYAVNTYGAVSFWHGLSVFASKVGVPFLSLAGWSSKLNQGEDEALEKIRIYNNTPAI